MTRAVRALASIAALLAVACGGTGPEPAAPRADDEATAVTHQPSPPARAAANASRCDAGDPAGCHAAALDAYYAPRSPETDARAAALFRRACDAGYAPSCNGLGVLMREGRGVAKDEAAAARTFRAACEKGASTACELLADALERGAGVPRDGAGAARARTRAECVLRAVSLHEGELAACPGLD